MLLDEIRHLVADEMEQVDQTIANEFGTDIDLIRQLSEHIFGSGGKRLRPMLVLLAAKTCAYGGSHHIQLAAIVELIHTATLLHDDVVDGSNLRRGKETANIVWGNEASVLVGDYLYSRAFQMMVKVESLPVMAILANAANTIAEGEVLQLTNCNNPHTSEQQYMDTICAKTATLFEAAAQLGAIISGRPQHETEALAKFGLHLGMAFQLIDDALDYGASDSNIGKNIGDDLAEGKPTLPLIHILKNGTDAQKALVQEAIKNAGTKAIDDIQQAIKATDAITYTYEAAKKQVALAQKELQHIPANSYRDGLASLANFAVNRKF